MSAARSPAVRSDPKRLLASLAGALLLAAAATSQVHEATGESAGGEHAAHAHVGPEVLAAFAADDAWRLRLAEPVPDEDDPALAAARERAAAHLRAELAPRTPGLAVAVATGERLLWRHVEGRASLESEAPLTADSRFRLGAITEVITVAALARLADAGHLDLDAPIGLYVDAFPDKEHVVTARQLAAHLGGIVTPPDDSPPPPSFVPVRAVLPRFVDLDLVAEPGTERRPTPYGFALLGTAISEVGGYDYYTVVQRTVFDPLGMTGAVLQQPGFFMLDRLVGLHERGEDGTDVAAWPDDLSARWASHGAIADVDDLARLGAAHLRPGMVGAARLDELLAEQRTRDGTPLGVALGWRLVDDDGGRRWHVAAGSPLGGEAVLALCRDLDLCVAVLANHGDAGIADGALALGLARPFVDALGR